MNVPTDRRICNQRFHLGHAWLVGSLVVAGLLVYWASPGFNTDDGLAETNRLVSPASVGTSSNAVVGTADDQDATEFDVGKLAIEKLRVGDRVLAYNPEIGDAERASWSEPEWQDWLKLTLLMPKPDGTELRIEMLRSEDWVRSQLGFVVEESTRGPPLLTNAVTQQSNTFVVEPQGETPATYTSTSIIAEASDDSKPAKSETQGPLVPLSPIRPIFRDLALTTVAIDELGEDVGIELLGLTIEMDLPELGLTGQAIVQGIEPASAVKTGPGQVVTATFHHSSGDVIDLVIGDTSGPGNTNVLTGGNKSNGASTETIGTTRNHPFWSVDRQSYIPAGDLKIGEHLRTYQGTTKQVLTKTPRPQTEPVYNLEVHAEHTYFVGEGILVHNSQRYAATGKTHPQFPNSTQVDYGEGLSLIARTRRASGGVRDGANVAVFEYVEGGVTKTKLFKSVKTKTTSLHSEDVGAIWLKKQGVDPANVKRVYSEFHPCNICDPNVRRIYSNAKIEFSWPYVTSKHPLSALGREAKKKALGEL